MRHIALVDDDRNILTSLSMILEDEGYRVDTYTDPERALTEFTRKAPDLAMVDVKMPRMDGFELLGKIRRFSALPVIMLTSLDSDLDAVTGLRLGADDYVTKPFSHRVLIERIRACSRRAIDEPEVRDDPEAAILETGPLHMDANRHTATWRGHGLRLTDKEYTILYYLARKPGYVRSRQQVLDLVHGEDFYASDRTVDTHIRRLRTKFKALDPDFEAIETLYGIGYRFAPPEA